MLNHTHREHDAILTRFEGEVFLQAIRLCPLGSPMLNAGPPRTSIAQIASERKVSGRIPHELYVPV